MPKPTKTLIVGASTNPERYAYKAAKMLLAHQHKIVLFGQKPGEIEGETIETRWKKWKGVDTVTLYLGPQNQSNYIPLILALQPRRVIFNPGTENITFEEACTQNNILPEIACTLVLLSTGQY